MPKTEPKQPKIAWEDLPVSKPPGWDDMIAQVTADTAMYDDPYLISFMGQFTTLRFLHPNRHRHPRDAYPSNYDLVHDLGEGPRVAKLRLPADVRPMTPQACFTNCLQMITERDDLIFCEGFATSQNGLLMVDHAWLQDQDGRIIDPTWAPLHGIGDIAVYHGLKFSSRFTVGHSLLTGWSSILEGDTLYNEAKMLRYGCETDERGIITGLKERA